MIISVQASSSTDFGRYLTNREKEAYFVIEGNAHKIDKIASKPAECFNVNTDKQRIDSVHIKSNMRRLGRISIFSSGIHKFLVNLKRKHPELFKKINTQLVEKYFSDKSLTCFSIGQCLEIIETRGIKIVCQNL